METQTYCSLRLQGNFRVGMLGKLPIAQDTFPIHGVPVIRLPHAYPDEDVARADVPVHVLALDVSILMCCRGGISINSRIS